MAKTKRKLSAYNKCMSRELKGKMSGKTKAQRAALFKAAAKRCSGKTPKRASNPTKKRVSTRQVSARRNPKGGTRRMAKNSFNMNKIYGLIRKGAIVLPAIGIALSPKTMQQKIEVGTRFYFGYNMATGTFSWADLARGWTPAIGAQVVTRIIPAIGKIIRGLF